MNLFDILGPVMVGPSSSHTAGAVRIGFVSRKLLQDQPVSAKILLHGSFATTGPGHGTDRALVAGLLGMQPDDIRIPQSFEIAKREGLSFSFGNINLKDVHQGGDCLTIANAAAMAMKNLLGLVCDPIAGLVEVPCVKRNVIGTVNALSCADMAAAGIVSRIPPDQVIDAMKEVGDKMDVSLRETALGGLAQSAEGLKVAEQIVSTIV